MNIIDKILIGMVCTITELYNFACYLLHKPRPIDTPWPILIICRSRGHRDGVIWYNLSGLEPDMHCRNCGEDLS